MSHNERTRLDVAGGNQRRQEDVKPSGEMNGRTDYCAMWPISSQLQQCQQAAKKKKQPMWTNNIAQ